MRWTVALVWVFLASPLSGCFFLFDDGDDGDYSGGGGGTRPDAHVADARPDACNPITCAEAAVTCGDIDDHCGGTLACGTCGGPSTCAGQDEPNVCAIPLDDRACANGWCFENPAPMPFAPAATFALSASDVWAVGSRGIVIHFDGVRWTSVPSNTGADLYDIWMASATDGWLVGAGGTIRRWNGTAWTTVASSTTSDLRGVWGLSATDVWFVGAGVAKRWTGSLATVLAASTPDLVDVFVASASNVFAVGEGRVWKYSTGVWTTQTPESGTLTTYSLYRIVGTATTAFAIGRSHYLFEGEDLGFQWDGASSWTSMPHPGDPEYTDAFVEAGKAYAVTDESFVSLPDFVRVVGPGPTMATAAGYGGKRFVVTYNGVPYHGTAGAFINDGYGVRTSAINAIGSVGDTVWFGRAGDVLEWRGGLVTHETNASTITAIAGTARDDVYISTAYAMQHYDGTSWQSVAGPSSTPYNALQLTADGDLLVVGNSVQRKTATGWEEEAIASAPAELQWKAVDEQGGDVWIAGYTIGTSPPVGHVARRTAGAWTELPPPSMEIVCGIEVVAANDIWVTGSDGNTTTPAGKVSHWNGSTWTATTRPGTSSLCAVASFGGDLYVSGAPGDIQHRAPNGTWTVEPALAIGEIHALRATATALWAAGDYGSVMRRE
jgi:hypothetical protein